MRDIRGHARLLILQAIVERECDRLTIERLERELAMAMNGKKIDPGPKIRGANEAFKRYLANADAGAEKLTNHILGSQARLDAAIANTADNVTAHREAQIEQLREIDGQIEELERTNAAPLHASADDSEKPSGGGEQRPSVAGQAGSGGQQT